MKSKFWLADPETHDFPAAFDYLELLYPKKKVEAMVNNLKKTITLKRKQRIFLGKADCPYCPKIISMWQKTSKK